MNPRQTVGAFTSDRVLPTAQLQLQTMLICLTCLLIEPSQVQASGGGAEAAPGQGNSAFYHQKVMALWCLAQYAGPMSHRVVLALSDNSH